MLENTTRFTKETYRKFMRFSIYKIGLRKVLLTIFLVFMLLVGVSMLFTSYYTLFVSRAEDESLPPKQFMGIIFTVSSAVYLFMPVIATRSAVKNSPDIFTTGIDYKFSEEQFSLTYGSNLTSGASNVKYDVLFRAYETREFFYICPQKSQAYLVDKKGFTQGTPEELSALLAKVLPPKKFRKYK